MEDGFRTLDVIGRRLDDLVASSGLAGMQQADQALTLGALQSRVESLEASSDPAMQHANQALVQELRNSFDALVPLFLNTASTIGRIGKTVEELTGRVQAMEHKVIENRAIEHRAMAGRADTNRG